MLRVLEAEVVISQIKNSILHRAYFRLSVPVCLLHYRYVFTRRRRRRELHRNSIFEK